MPTIPVSKYHGCGNDFVLARESDVAAAGLDAADFTRAVCDRHLGIGADGTILAGGEAAGGSGPLWMRYRNADGSVAPMCGNGIRCLAAYCADEGICAERSYPIETLAGTKVVTRVSADGDPYVFKVDMGTPDWSPASLGVTATTTPIRDYALDLPSGACVQVWALFMATDHAVILTDDAMAEKNMALGREVCHHPLFPRQINANFVQVTGEGSIIMRTYERGCGPTLACGTGVCASVVVAHEAGLVGADVDVTVPGGHIYIQVNEDGHVLMSGGATRIMRGECFL